MQNRLVGGSINILRLATVIKGTFTIVFGTRVCTSVANGLVTGDVVKLSNSGGALPAGLASTTKYFVKTINADTFYLYMDSSFVTPAPATGNGTGTNSFNLVIRTIHVADYQHLELGIDTANNAAITLKAVGSNAELAPDFTAAQTAANEFKYLALINLDDRTSLAGSTGIALTGTDVHKSYEINTNGITWLSFEISGWSAGNVDLSIRGYGNI
jgi:hypothetical protein